MRVCLFDWDGTLLDNAPIWYETIKRVFQKYGQESLAPSVGEFFQELDTYGGDYYQVYRSRGLNISQNELNANFAIIHKELLAQSEPQLATNAQRTLRILHGNGVTLGLITAQKEDLVMPFLERFGLLRLFKYLRFHAIDKKTAIETILLKERVCGRDCCYVGDAPSDMRHANNAGVISVAFLGGHVPEVLVMATRPRKTIKDFQELIVLM